MKILAQALERAGYLTINLNYHSLKYPVDKLVNERSLLFKLSIFVAYGLFKTHAN